MHTWCTQGIFRLKPKTKHLQEISVQEREGRKTNQSNSFPPLKERWPLKAFLMNHKTREGGSREKQKWDFYLSVTLSSISTAKGSRGGGRRHHQHCHSAATRDLFPSAAWRITHRWTFSLGLQDCFNNLQHNGIRILNGASIKLYELSILK